MIRSLAFYGAILIIILVTIYIYFEDKQEQHKLTDAIRKEAPGKFISLNHGQVHYSLNGSPSSELVVFIHGGGITGMEVWEKNISFFTEKGYRTLAFDLYGRGYSERPLAKNSPDLFLEQITQLLTKLNIQDTFNIVAMSMGAIVAIDYAHANPGRVKKLILIDPAASGNYKPVALLRLPVVSHFFLTTYWYPRALENQRKEFVDQGLFDAYAKRLSYFMNFEGYKHTNYSTWMNMLTQNKLSVLNNLKISDLLLIYGTEDPYFNENLEVSYRSNFPSMRVIKIKEAGHMPHYEKPAEVNTVIESFLHEEPRMMVAW